MTTASMNLASVTWDSVTFDGLIDHVPTLLGRVIPRSSGVADWSEETKLAEKLYQIEIIFDDGVTYKNLTQGTPNRLGGVEATLTVKANKTDGTLFFQYAYVNARITAIRNLEGHNKYGNFSVTFTARSADGLASPLTVTEG